MKEVLIRVVLDGDKIGSAVKHSGFKEGENLSLEQILTTIGILEALKQQFLNTIGKNKVLA